MFQTSICIWPFLQFFNFRFVPFAGRPIFVGVMAFFWTTLLAFWKSQPIVKHEKPEVVRDPK